MTEVAGLFERGEAFAAAVLTDERGQVSWVAHVGRRPTTAAELVEALTWKGHDVRPAHGRRPPDAYQRTALEWTSPTCSVAGCDQPRQEIDHRTGWARTLETRLDDLDGLCKFHHRIKDEGFRVDAGVGRRVLRPPGDREAEWAERRGDAGPDPLAERASD